MTDVKFFEFSKNAVRNYVINHLDKSDTVPNFDVYIVWYCKTLQNWKALLSTTLFDGMYYELTLNGDKDEAYLDAYKKWDNNCIKIPAEYL
jgi:hypothetical protein